IIYVVPSLICGRLPRIDRSREEPRLERQELSSLFLCEQGLRCLGPPGEGSFRKLVYARPEKERNCVRNPSFSLCFHTFRKAAAAHYKLKPAWRCTPAPGCLSRLGRRNSRLAD